MEGLRNHVKHKVLGNLYTNIQPYQTRIIVNQGGIYTENNTVYLYIDFITGQEISGNRTVATLYSPSTRDTNLHILFTSMESNTLMNFVIANMIYVNQNNKVVSLECAYSMATVSSGNSGKFYAIYTI